MSEDCHDSNNRHVHEWAPKRIGAVKERLTAEQINSLPEFAREWIHDLARNADPAGTLAELRLLQEAFKAQEILITELRGEIEVPDEGGPFLAQCGGYQSFAKTGWASWLTGTQQNRNCQTRCGDE
jgi:hypothetical protein